MNGPRIIDAGPVLNFFSTSRERLLFSVLGRISAPEIVEEEVLRKADTDPRFAPAGRVWGRAKKSLISILPDATTHELSRVVQRITDLPLDERRKNRKDLGETMVIAHAIVIAESGLDVVVIVDEGNGVRQATLEAGRLDRLRSQGRDFGHLSLVRDRDDIATRRRHRASSEQGRDAHRLRATQRVRRWPHAD